MCMTIRRFIAVYSPTTASIETCQQKDLFAQPEQECGDNLSRETFLCQLSSAKRQMPIGYCLAYLRYIQPQPDYFALLLEWLKQRCYSPTITLANHQVTAIAITCLYMVIKQHELLLVEKALQAYGFQSKEMKLLEVGVSKVRQLNEELEEQYEAFVGMLEELESSYTNKGC